MANRLFPGLALGMVVVLACGGQQPSSAPRAVHPQRQDLGTASTGYDYAYDPAGRLVEVIAPNGEAARYVYDPAGNILAIERYPAGTLAVLGFSPPQGSVGQLVTATGIGFSAVAGENAVSVNGTAASVLSSTPAELTFLVPAGATTGKVAVTVAGTSAASADDFVVVESLVSISDFTPKFGKPGTSITVTGTGFDIDPVGDNLWVASRQQVVVAPTSTSLQFSVAQYTGSGHLRLETSLGTATSANPFVIVPSTYAVTDVVSFNSAPLGVDVTATVNTGGKIAVLYFDATAGQGCTLFIKSNTLAGTTAVQLFAPDGTILVSTGLSSAPAKIELGAAPVSGTYVIVFRAAPTSTGAVTLQRIPEATGSFSVDGAPASFGVAAAQDGRYTFTGTAGDILAFGVSALTTTPVGQVVWFGFYKPDGSQLTWVQPNSAYGIQLPVLPTSGAYTLLASPAGTSAATFTVLLSHNVTGTTSVDGGTARMQTTRIGQIATYTFPGSAGQAVTMRATMGPQGGSVRVLNPDGTQLTAANLSGSQDLKIDLGILPATGTYTIVFSTTSPAVGYLDVRLISGAPPGSIAVDGNPASFSLAAAQNGRYTFTGTAGDILAFGVSALTTTPAGQIVWFGFYKPDGSQLTWVQPNSAFGIQLPVLPTSGTYTVLASPAGTSAATFTVLLSHNVTGTTSIDGGTARMQTTRIGQIATYTFPGSSGQAVTMRATMGPQGGSVRVVKPDGTQLTSAALSPNQDAKIDFGTLAATGTYSIVFSTTSPAVGYVDVQLISWAPPGSITVDGSPASFSLAAAQNGRYTFTGTAGDILAFGVSALTTTPAGQIVWFGIYKPDGSQLTWAQPSGPYGMQLPALPASGTYTLYVSASGTSAATFTVLLSHNVTGTTSIDGGTARIQTTRTGQIATYTFPGSAGQAVTMRATMGPQGGSVRVLKPDGSQLTNTNLSANQDAKIDFGTLAATGTYSIVFSTTSPTVGYLDVQLISWAPPGSITVDGSPASFSLAAAQNGRYTFTGTAGDILAFGVSALATTPAGQVVWFGFYKPDGSQLTWVQPSGPYGMQLPALPASGTYTLYVSASGTSAATFTVLLSHNVTGTTSIDGGTARIQTTRTGQIATYTFPGTAGQAVTLRATVSSQGGSVKVVKPDGSQLTFATLSANQDAKIDLGLLPATGTYKIVFTPPGAAVGYLDVQLMSYATGSPVVNGGQASFTLSSAQNGRYTFAGATGDVVTFTVSALSTTPAGNSVWLGIYKPDGSQLWWAQPSGAGSWRLPTLPASGTYVLYAVPTGTAGATFTISLTK